MRKRFMSTANGRATVALTATFGVFCGTLARAQDSLTVDVGDCVKLKSPAERFECYERQVDAAETKSPAAPPAPAPAPDAHAAAPGPAPTAAAPSAGAAAATAAPPTAASSPVAKPATPDAQNAGKSDKSSPADIVATITELHETVPNSFTITLDNGQVWRQSYPEQYFLRPGMQVTLRSSKWGASYRLSAEGLRGFIQVQRVK